MVVLIAAMVVAVAGAAGAEEVPRVGIAVYSLVHVPGTELTGAEQQVADIYRRVPVDIVWRTRTPAADRQSHLELTVIILARPIAGRPTPGGEMGFTPIDATGPGRVAYLSYDRITAMADSHHIDRVRMLALALAHEIGHMLLPVGSHSVDGLMRARWTHGNLQSMRGGPVELSNTQSRLVRARLNRWVAPVERPTLSASRH